MLNARQQRFCDEYLISGNATQSAIKAGYSEKTAYSHGQRLLKDVEIKSYIEERMTEIKSEKIATAEEVLQYLTSVLRGETRSHEIVVDSDGARVMSKPPSEKDRLKSAELIGKRYGIYTEKLNVEGAIPVVIKDDVDEDC
jgi:phage terminase small subunit